MRARHNLVASTPGCLAVHLKRTASACWQNMFKHSLAGILYCATCTGANKKDPGGMLSLHAARVVVPFILL